MLLRSAPLSCLVLILVSSSGVAAAYNLNAPLIRSQQTTIGEHLLWQYQLTATPTFTALDAQGDTVAVVIDTSPHRLLLIDTEKGFQLWNFTLPEPSSTNITCLSISADGDYVALGTSSGSVYILEGSSGGITQNWSLPGTIRQVALSEHGTFLVIAVAGFLVYASRLQATFLWSQYFVEAPHYFRILSFNRIGSSFAAGVTDGHLYSIQAGNGETLWEYTFDAAVNYLSLTVDDSLLVAATDNTCVVFSHGGAVQQEYNLESQAIALSLTGRYFTLVPNDTVYIYSDNQLRPQYNYTFPAPITSLSLPRDGEYLLAGDDSGTIYALYTQEAQLLWYAPLNEPILDFLIPEEEGHFIVVTPTSLTGFLLVSRMVGIHSTQALVFIALSTIALVALTLWLIFPRQNRKP